MSNEVEGLDTGSSIEKLSNSNHTLPQLELIKRWRSSLGALMNDIRFDIQVKPENDKFESVRENAEYLYNINNLLDENDDFQLSDSGFTKYKTKHLQVFEKLSSFLETEKKNIESKFYFTNIHKHLDQQLIPSKLKHCLSHLALIVLVCFILMVFSVSSFIQTQNNVVVYILIFLCVFSQFNVIAVLFKAIKSDAATPLKFKISLLSIHLLNILKRTFWICLLPTLFIVKFNPYWIDDVIILSLFVLYLSIKSPVKYSKYVTHQLEIENKNV